MKHTSETTIKSNHDNEYDIASEIFISSWPDWLRWTLMVPLTILGALIIPILYKIAVLIGNSIGNFVGDGWDWWFIDIMQSLIMGIVLVLIPSYVAPKKQLLISIIFLTITALVFGILLTFNIPLFEKTGAKLYIALLTILPIVGAAATTYQISQSA